MQKEIAARFKVGSMVVHKKGIGIIKRYDPSLAVSPIFVEFTHCSSWIKPSELKCVRKPRKGSKEARDIVAKLTWLYLAQLKKCKSQQNPVYELWKKRYGTLAYEEWALSYKTLSTLHTAREAAKSMLKDACLSAWDAALNQWQPIDDTTPHNEEILVCNGKWQFVAQWAKNPYTDDEAWMIARLDNGESVLIKDPTHWQPLPQLPKQ